MDSKELQKLSRRQLLELMIEQSKRIEELEQELASVKEELADRKIILENVGSIAEASLQLNHVFEVAQKAADQYLESVYHLEEYNKKD